MPVSSDPVTSEPASQSHWHAETLAQSVVILLAMTAIQRVVGFGRGILFCRWMSAEQLGEWDVAFGFLMLAAPLAVLGLPGSFGRYCEYYRQRGQLRVFLRRTTLLSAVMALLAMAVVFVGREQFSVLIFGQRDHASVVGWLAITLGVVILHNFLVSLFIAVRMYRVVTALQFWQTIGFAVISLALLKRWDDSSTSVVIAFALATFTAAVVSVSWLRQVWNAAHDHAGATVAQSAFWAKLIPFALWIWLTNLLSNLFEVIDRYMIVHHSGLEPLEALGQVGNYHSSRIIPLLFVSVTLLLGSLITPHLSFDWEAGRRKAVADRLNLVLKAIAIALFVISISVLFAAPWLFNGPFKGKFEGGLAVLPLTLAYCSWFGLSAVAQNYLWCAERAGLSGLALLAGLLLNIVLNLVLLPRYGLEGAVWATAVANLVAIALIYYFNVLAGMHVQRGTWICTFAPAVLWFGPLASLGVLMVLGLLAVSTDWILTADDKHQFAAAARTLIERLRPARLASGAAGADAPLS